MQQRDEANVQLAVRGWVESKSDPIQFSLSRKAKSPHNVSLAPSPLSQSPNPPRLPSLSPSFYPDQSPNMSENMNTMVSGYLSPIVPPPVLPRQPREIRTCSPRASLVSGRSALTNRESMARLACIQVATKVRWGARKREGKERERES